jgi:hypothetical protein
MKRFKKLMIMSNAQTANQTMKAYANGQKAMAFIAFKNDPTAVQGITFEQFCNYMDKALNEVLEVCHATKKAKLAKDYL